MKNPVKPKNKGDKRRFNKPPRSPGRPKGVPNKTTQLLRDAILLAAREAGGKGELVGYLRRQALENPTPFLGLLGKVLPLQLANADNSTLKISVIEQIIVKAED